MINLKGWRTLGFSLLLIIIPPALHYLAGVNWTEYLSPTWAPVVAGGIALALRIVTTTPIFKSAVMIFALVGLGWLAFPAPSYAQTTPPAALTAVEQQVTTALNQIIGFVGGIAQADLSAAIADAQGQTPPNAVAVACWQTLAKIPQTQIPAGAGLAYLKQKFLDMQGLYAPMNSNCGSVAPLALKFYNQFMAQAAALNL